MKIIVIGGSGLIGSKLVKLLQAKGHDVVAASPSSGVSTLTGEGLAAALAGADTVVDVTNSPSFEAAAVLSFFETSTRNQLAAERVAGVKHHVALSVVGVDRGGPDLGYFVAKLAQERLIAASPVPYSIVRATQFFEFLGAIAGQESPVRLSSAAFQPIAAADVAAALCDVVLGAPSNGIVDIAGPERSTMAALVTQALRAKQDPREVVTDPHATYFGAPIADDLLVPAGAARLGPTSLAAWLSAAS